MKLTHEAARDKTQRRKWFLSRMERVTPSRGSDYEALMEDAPMMIVSWPLDDLFGENYAIVGGVATRAYQPERVTKDVDVLVQPAALEMARSRLAALGATVRGPLLFGDSQLELVGEIWAHDEHGELDVMWADSPWAAEAIAQARRDRTGLRVVPLGHLVLMKLDASRSVDQGDLARMLGLASDADVAEARAVIGRYFPDASDDFDSYVRLGRLEVSRPLYQESSGGSLSTRQDFSEGVL